MSIYDDLGVRMKTYYEQIPKTTVSIIKRTLPDSEMTVSEYRTWLLEELKTLSAMQDTDKVSF